MCTGWLFKLIMLFLAMSIPVINFPADPQHLQSVAMLMVKTPKDNMEEIDKKEAKKERVEHKGRSKLT